MNFSTLLSSFYSPRRSSSGFKICKGVTAKMLLMHLCKNYMQLLLEALEYKAKRSSMESKTYLPEPRIRRAEDPSSSSALFAAAAAAARIKMFLKVKIERHRPSTNDFRKLSKLRKISMLLHAFLRCIL